MAIVSTTEIKSFLGIPSSDTTLDDRIAAYLLPTIVDFFDNTNNYFDNNSVLLNTSGISASSSGPSITLENTNFSTWGFVAGDEIRVRNSRRNDGFYTISSMTGATITVASSSVSAATFTIRDELTNEATWLINTINVPQSVKPVIASMIKFKIDHPEGIPQGESLGDYSVTYGNASGYPDGIARSMNKFRVVKFA